MKHFPVVTRIAVMSPEDSLNNFDQPENQTIIELVDEGAGPIIAISQVNPIRENQRIMVSAHNWQSIKETVEGFLAASLAINTCGD